MGAPTGGGDVPAGGHGEGEGLPGVAAHGPRQGGHHEEPAGGEAFLLGVTLLGWKGGITKRQLDTYVVMQGIFFFLHVLHERRMIDIPPSPPMCSSSTSLCCRCL